jgi:S-DNA-T family DNA segregation ATPase FtsK/SpoIIIE
MHAFVRFDPLVARYYIGNARSGLAGLPGWVATATTIAEAVDLAKELTQAVSADLTTEPATPRIAIVIENLADFLQTPADSVLVELIKQVKRSDHFLVADGETASWNSSWPLFAEMKNTRRGLLLQPDTIEGDILLKTPLPRLNRAEFPPGRGMMVACGRVVRVQLPLVE